MSKNIKEITVRNQIGGNEKVTTVTLEQLTCVSDDVFDFIQRAESDYTKSRLTPEEEQRIIMSKLNVNEQSQPDNRSTKPRNLLR